MSLVGFRAQNHPQQTVKDAVDDRGTSAEFFAQMVERFGPFTLDVAAAPHNAKCERYFTIEDDGLEQSWAGERVWCNPPYSNIGAWVEKASRSDAELVVMLLPANRTEQRWWQEWIEPNRLNGSLCVEFLAGRMRFDRPGAVIGPKGDRPPFGCCLVIWGGDVCELDTLRGLVVDLRQALDRWSRIDPMSLDAYIRSGVHLAIGVEP